MDYTSKKGEQKADTAAVSFIEGQRTPRLLACLLLLAGVQASAVAAGGAERAYILDAGAPALVALDLSSGEPVAWGWDIASG